ncbi:MAG: fatty acid desaturase [Pirellulaceae bacterium]
MADAAEERSTLKYELKIGRENTPDFGWPTIVLTVALIGGFTAVCWMAARGGLSYFVAACLNTVLIYAFYTVVHEAVHGNISSRRTELRWLDTLCGTACCFPLWLFMDHHRKQHMVHHARTNEENDPDIYARGSFLGFLFIKLPLALINYFNPFGLLAECRRFGVTQVERRKVFITFAVNAAAVIGLVAAGYGYEVLVLWFVPWWIGQTVMLTLFTWAPHHDHSETGRYRNTRVSEWPGGNILLLGQGYHLIHHMMPAVPFYRYKRTFDQLRPILEAKSVRIEGFWPEPVPAAAS